MTEPQSETIQSHKEASRRRERVALALFIALLLLGGLLLIGYFGTGRSWTVAATMVDDSVGSLEDYSVVVFSGIEEPAQTTGTTSAASEDGVDEDRTMLDAYDASGSDAPSSGTVFARIMDAYYRLDKRQSLSTDRVFVSDVRDLYEIKGAEALTINIADTGYYAVPIVLKTGSKSYGVFSVTSYTSRAELKKIVNAFDAQQVDGIICIASRSAMISTYDGIDVVICTDRGYDEVEMVHEGPDAETLIVGSPERGSVGVVIFSSNNVPTFKVIEEL